MKTVNDFKNSESGSNLQVKIEAPSFKYLK